MQEKETETVEETHPVSLLLSHPLFFPLPSAENRCPRLSRDPGFLCVCVALDTRWTRIVVDEKFGLCE